MWRSEPAALPEIHRARRPADPDHAGDAHLSKAASSEDRQAHFRPGPLGHPIPDRGHLLAGTYVLHGSTSGTASVQIGVDNSTDSVDSVSVSYRNFSDDGFHVINGSESAAGGGGILQHVLFHENLKLSGKQTGSKVTSEPGGYDLTISAVDNIIMSTGSLTT